jgi:hypothetical protein
MKGLNRSVHNSMTRIDLRHDDARILNLVIHKDTYFNSIKIIFFS